MSDENATTPATPEPEVGTSSTARTDASESPAPAPDSGANADIASMGYEQARDELAQIVSTLESGRAPLEESMRLWERGEALADHCSTWLDGAQSRIEEAVARREGTDPRA